ncbi:MAG TPA: GNAT family N-acetyltransferase [Blastocatellia bacterium]|jgi:putative acetyltransferase|nr:GNAT family N-acetyltransferase [Blastocatellia bacterium]
MTLERTWGRLSELSSENDANCSPVKSGRWQLHYHNEVTQLKVEGLLIRRAEPNDYSAIHEIFSSTKVFPGTLQLPYPSLEQWRQRLAGPGDGAYNLVAVVDDRVVGMFDVHTFPNRPRRRHVGVIGMCVHEEWQGKGVGAALMRAGVELADKWLNLLRLELEVFTDNEPAIRLYERFGFEREGTLRQHAFRDGNYVDSYVMARLRPSGNAS